MSKKLQFNWIFYKFNRLNIEQEEYQLQLSKAILSIKNSYAAKTGLRNLRHGDIKNMDLMLAILEGIEKGEITDVYVNTKPSSNFRPEN